MNIEDFKKMSSSNQLNYVILQDDGETFISTRYFE